LEFRQGFDKAELRLRKTETRVSERGLTWESWRQNWEKPRLAISDQGRASSIVQI